MRGSESPRYRSLRIRILKDLNAQLDPNLTYHGIHHTLDVMNVCNGYIRRLSLSRHQALLLRTAALMHDYGFVSTYIEHEQKGVDYSKKLLPEYGYEKKDIVAISEMILATKIPQSPKSPLAEILCDADLDYLGRDDFKKIGDTLFSELKQYTPMKTIIEWNVVQYNFLLNHHYFTPYARKHREPKKQQHLKGLKSWIIKHAPDKI